MNEPIRQAQGGKDKEGRQRIGRSISLRFLRFAHGLLDLAAGLLKSALCFQLWTVAYFAGDFLGFAGDDVAASARDIGGARFHKMEDFRLGLSHASTRRPAIRQGGQTPLLAEGIVPMRADREAHPARYRFDANG
jgi:hypothetical protein